jgi:hypothetical protein
MALCIPNRTHCSKQNPARRHSQTVEYSNCDIYYKDKNEYLLFLRKDGEKYFMKHCSYSEHIDNAKDNLKAIEKELKK